MRGFEGRLFQRWKGQKPECKSLSRAESPRPWAQPQGSVLTPGGTRKEFKGRHVANNEGLGEEGVQYRQEVSVCVEIRDRKE